MNTTTQPPNILYIIYLLANEVLMILIICHLICHVSSGLIVKQQQQKQPIVTFEKLEPGIFCSFFFFFNTLNNESTISPVTD